MSDVAVYAEAERIVAALTDEQCDAVLTAIYKRGDEWELEHRQFSSFAVEPCEPSTTSQASPARRRVGLLEAIRGNVECCDPKVVREWQVFRRWLAVTCVIVGVVLILEPWQRGALIAVACVVSLGVRFSMTRGKASVCH